MSDGTRSAGFHGGIGARQSRGLAREVITYDVASGELRGPLGPSGAGRTTALEVLSALLGASDGPSRASSRRRSARGRR